MIDYLASSIGWDASKFFDARTRQRLATALHKAGFKSDAGKWLGFSLACAVFALILIGLTVYAVTGQLPASAAAALACGATTLFVLHSLPFRSAAKRAEEVETDLPVALRTVATELGLKASFERAIESATRYGAAGAEFKRVLGDVKRGKSFPEALRQMGERVDSVLAKRSAMQLSLAFEEGRAEGLRRLADELVVLQKERVKRYAAKQGLLSLAFVAIGGILPAFFGAYVVVGSAFLDSQFSTGQVLAVFLLFFPLADAAILLYLRSTAPKVIESA